MEDDDEPEPLELTADMLAELPQKRVTFERGMTRFPPLSVGLIFLLAAAFAWELSVGALDSKEALLRAGALRRVEVLKGEVWRFVTGMNMHGNTDHLVSNCVGLFVVGLAVEHAYGIGSALVMYVVAGLVGGIFCVAFEGEATVGASGFSLSG